MTTTALTIVVSGMIAADPHQGGATWAVLQYVLGLEQLGHRVVLVEPAPSNGSLGDENDPATAASARYFSDVVNQFGLADRAALVLPGDGRKTIGMPYDQLRAACRGADVLLNVSGMLTDPDLAAEIPIRAYLDLDPAFVQLWAEQGIDMRFGRHTHFVTVGLALGGPECEVPLGGRDWITTLQPVVLDYWPVGEELQHDAFTTVGNWRGYGSVELNGRLLGQKAHSLRNFFPLPRRTDEQFLLAMAIHPDEKPDLSALAENGWRLADPRAEAGTPNRYGRFVRGSKAEFGIAKSGYVESRCGWFSDRSVCYLASGRPVVAQDTGFRRFLPCGEGLFAFSTEDDVLTSIDAINRDYDAHRRAARKIAETYFAADRVLPQLLTKIGATS